MGEALLLENCGVLDVRAGTVAPGSAVRVEGGRIAAVGAAGEVSGEGARRIDLRGATVLPGLINCHVHFGLVLPGTEGDKLRDESEAALALRMAANARAALRCGITTVRLVGERPYADLARAWGGTGYVASTVAEFREALADAEHAPSFALIETRVDPHDLSPVSRKYIEASARKAGVGRKIVAARKRVTVG